MFEVWQSDECKHDCKVKIFSTWEDANDFIMSVQKYDTGWYWYIKETERVPQI